MRVPKSGKPIAKEAVPSAGSSSHNARRHGHNRAKFFTQDGVIRVSFGDASPQQLLRASVRLRDF